MAVAGSTETPPDLAFSYAIGVLSCATRDCWIARIKVDWMEILAPWQLVLLPSGNLKTAVANMVMAPLVLCEIALVEQHKAEHAGLQARYDIAKDRATAAKKAAVNDPTLTEEAVTLAKEAEALKQPPRPRLYMTDVTPEAAEDKCAEQGGTLSVFSTEGAYLQNIKGRYNDGQVNTSFANDANSGSPTRAGRIGRGETIIPRPFLELCLSLQNDVARGLADGGLDGSGFMGRFFFSVPQSLLGSRTFDGAPVPPAASARWAERVEGIFNQATVSLLSVESSVDTRTELLLNPQAWDVLQAFRKNLEGRQKPDGDLADGAIFSGWASKLPGNLTRIAALFALMRNPATQQVTSADMKAAVALGDYFIAHAQITYGLMCQTRLNPVTPEQQVMSWVEKAFRKGDTFTVEEMRKAMENRNWSKKGGAEARQAVRESLVQKAWLRRRQSVPRQGVGRPAVVFEINPATWPRRGEKT
jgi:hypothetical protein